MKRFRGVVGFISGQREHPANSGNWVNDYQERLYSGTLIRKAANVDDEAPLGDLSVGHRISIVADEHAHLNLASIRYVMWAGERWTVTSVESNRPRLILSLGEVFNGVSP